jgi:hypothetical protein
MSYQFEESESDSVVHHIGEHEGLYGEMKEKEIEDCLNMI